MKEISTATNLFALRPLTLSETNCITKRTVAPLRKSLTNTVLMTTVTSPNATAPKFTNTPVPLPTAETNVSKIKAMPLAMAYTFIAATKPVQAERREPTRAAAEGQPPTTAATPVIILISPVAIPPPTKPVAPVDPIPATMAVADIETVVQPARNPNQNRNRRLPASTVPPRPQAPAVPARHLLPEAETLHLPPPVPAVPPRPQAPAAVTKKTPAFPAEVPHVRENPPVPAMKNQPAAAKIAREKRSIPAKPKPVPSKPAATQANPAGNTTVRPVPDNAPTVQRIPAGTVPNIVRIPALNGATPDAALTEPGTAPAAQTAAAMAAEPAKAAPITAAIPFGIVAANNLRFQKIPFFTKF